MDESGDGFILVKSKKVSTNKSKKGKGALRNVHSLRDSICEIESNCGLNDRQNNFKKIESAIAHIKSSKYVEAFFSTLDESLLRLNTKVPISKIICYGLGCFVDCTIARYQLALLTCLKANLNIESVELYDPMFSTLEKIVLEDNLNFHVIKTNEQCKRTVSQPTLFYMPHCPHQLVNNLLYANWDVSALEKCVIISNSLQRVAGKIEQMDNSLSYITAVQPFAVEYDIINNFQYADIFNDTAIHIFPRDKLDVAAAEVWNDKDEPLYDSKEFI